MNAYWAQWSAQEIDYCLGRDFRALTDEDDKDDTDLNQYESDTDLNKIESMRCSARSVCGRCMDCLGMSTSDFY